MARSILVVDAVATNRIVLKARLGSAFYDVATASTGAEALRQIHARPPDLIVISQGGDNRDGPDLCRQLKSDPTTAALPIIALVDPGGSGLAALHGGADDVLMRPHDDRVLLARVRNLLRHHDEIAGLLDGVAGMGDLGLAEAAATFQPPGRVALVTERPETALRWRAVLAPYLRNTELTVLRPDDPRDPGPDLLLVEAGATDHAAGLPLLAELRARAAGRPSAICLVAAAADADFEALALDLGADDILPAGLMGEEAALRIRNLLSRQQRRNQQRRRVAENLRLAMRDPLTGLYNRRYAQPALTRLLTGEAGALPGAGRGCAVLILDIDRFKAINDTYGHPVGDRVLVVVAERLRQALGPDDLIARIGGEEFLIALADVTLAEAWRMAECLRQSMASSSIMVPGTSGGLAITVSIGIGRATSPADTGDQVIDRADRALLLAKTSGRNRVCGPSDEFQSAPATTSSASSMICHSGRAVASSFGG